MTGCRSSVGLGVLGGLGQSSHRCGCWGRQAFLTIRTFWPQGPAWKGRGSPSSPYVLLAQDWGAGNQECSAALNLCDSWGPSGKQNAGNQRQMGQQSSGPCTWPSSGQWPQTSLPDVFSLVFLVNFFKTQLTSSLFPEAFSLKQKKYLFLLGVPRTLDIIRYSCQVATLYCDGIVKWLCSHQALRVGNKGNPVFPVPRPRPSTEKCLLFPWFIG